MEERETCLAQNKSLPIEICRNRKWRGSPQMDGVIWHKCGNKTVNAELVFLILSPSPCIAWGVLWKFLSHTLVSFYAVLYKGGWIGCHPSRNVGYSVVVLVDSGVVVVVWAVLNCLHFQRWR